MCRFVFVDPKYYRAIEEYRNLMLEAKSSFDGCSQLENYTDIEKWNLNNKLFESIDTCPPGYSIGFIYLYINDNDEIIGMLNLRPDALNHPFLKQYGGHIGYSINPKYRKMGYGKRMLKEYLPICKNEYKLNKVLITCHKSNIGSRNIIVNNGGIYESDVFYAPDNEYIERYWISIE